MKKTVILAALSFLALLIVLPIKSIVNHPLGNPVLDNGTLRADGFPGPPLPPKKPRTAPVISPDTQLLVADGFPGPPLPPKKPYLASNSLVAS
jgi:hypothetical protein